MTTIREHRVPVLQTCQVVSVGRITAEPRQFPGEVWHRAAKVSWEGDEGRRASQIYISPTADGDFRPGHWEVRSATEKEVEYHDSTGGTPAVGDWLWAERTLRGDLEARRRKP